MSPIPETRKTMSLIPSDVGPQVKPLVRERVVLFTWKGAATDSGLTAAQKMVDAELRSTGYQCVLADLRGLEKFPISFTSLQALARMHGSFGALAQVRIGVVAVDPAARGLIRAYQLVSSTQGRLKIFESYDQALAWACSS